MRAHRYSIGTRPALVQGQMEKHEGITMRKTRDKKVDVNGRVRFDVEVSGQNHQRIRRYAFDNELTKIEVWDRIMGWFFDPANGVCDSAPERQWGRKK